MASRSAITFLLLSLVLVAGCDRQSPGAEQASANTAAPAAAPVPSGGVDRSHKGEAAPDLAFQTPDGATTKVAAFKGTPVLLNLWATWCAPCVKEMPALNTLAGQSGDRLQVVTVSQDMDKAKIAPFLSERNLTNLKAYADPNLSLSVGYAANLPMTILYGADGREIWRVTGAMDWTGPQAKALIAEAA